MHDLFVGCVTVRNKFHQANNFQLGANPSADLSISPTQVFLTSMTYYNSVYLRQDMDTVEGGMPSHIQDKPRQILAWVIFRDDVGILVQGECIEVCYGLLFQ